MTDVNDGVISQQLRVLIEMQDAHDEPDVVEVTQDADGE